MRASFAATLSLSHSSPAMPQLCRSYANNGDEPADVVSCEICGCYLVLDRSVTQ